MLLGGLRSDLKLAWRALRRQPAFSLVAVLSLAVAIGANATIFGLVDAVLFRPLPGERAAPLVSVFTSESDNNGFGTTSYPAYLDLRERKDLFTHVAASAITPLLLTEDERSEKALGMLVSGDWFATLGARAALGRVILPADDRTPGESPVVVLSDTFWRRRYGADPGVVGREVRINGHPWTVVGVLPPDFRNVFVGLTPDLYVPTRMEAWAQPGRSEQANRGGRSFMVLGQLARGLSMKQVQARLDALAAELGREHPASDSGRAFLMALGAARTDVQRMILGQATRLTVLGLGIGLAAAYGLTRLMAGLLFGVRPDDPPTFGFVTLVLAASAVIAAWLPASRAVRVDPVLALRHE